jgi:hypothetical protein
MRREVVSWKVMRSKSRPANGVCSVVPIVHHFLLATSTLLPTNANTSLRRSRYLSVTPIPRIRISHIIFASPWKWGWRRQNHKKINRRPVNASFQLSDHSTLFLFCPQCVVSASGVLRPIHERGRFPPDHMPSGSVLASAWRIKESWYPFLLTTRQPLALNINETPCFAFKKSQIGV